MLGQDQVTLLGGQVLNQLHRSARGILGLLASSQILVGLGQLGVGEREILVLLDRVFEELHRLQVVPLAHQLETLVVVAKGDHRARGRDERLLLEIFDGSGRERQVVPHPLSELLHRAQQLLFAVRLGLDGCGLMALEITDGGVDPDLITELEELAPDNGVGIGKIGDPAQGHLLEGGAGGDAQIAQDLVETIGGHRSKIG